MNTLTGLARKKWISECQFHDLTQIEVLEEVATQVRKKKNPLVLLDLDSTLYEVSPRTHRILVEWAESSESSKFSTVRSSVLQMTRDHLGYSIQDTFIHLGLLQLENPGISEALESAKEFWMKRFFSSEYLQYDHAYTGAADFVHRLYALGANIVYLTGRDEVNMGVGTRRNLERDGFPWNVPRTFLLMKPLFEHVDLDFKKMAAQDFCKQGSLVASFENEPPNLVALQKMFPESMHVFVDTVCSDQYAAPCQGLYRIFGFCN